MKKIELITILNLISLSYLIAQDYQTVRSDRIAYFDDQYGNVKCIRIDSLINQKDSIFFPFPNIQQLDYACFTPYGGSWIGNKIIIQNTGFDIFFNKKNDTIKIKRNAQLDEQWIAYEIKDSITIVAQITNIDTLDIIGMLDSAKTISFQVFDKNMTLLSHGLNNMSIVLSKYYGLVKTFNFYLFPVFEGENYLGEQFQELNLKGLSRPQIGIQNLTWFEVFDFQTGDEIHSLYTEDCWGTGWNDYSITQKTIVKYLSRIDYLDSIVYEIEIKRSKFTRWIDTSSFEFLHDTRKQVIVPNLIFDKLPGETIIEEYEAYTYFMTNGNIISKTEPSDYEKIWPSDDSCWRNCCVDGCFPSYTYLKGLGGAYYWCDNYFFCIGGTENKLVYYKKGEVTWGTPIIVTNISDINQDENIIVFPNPTKDNLCLYVPEDVLPITFELIDIKGQIFLKKEINSDISSINIESFCEGTYLYRISNKSGIIRSDRLLVK